MFKVGDVLKARERGEQEESFLVVTYVNDQPCSEHYVTKGGPCWSHCKGYYRFFFLGGKSTSTFWKNRDSHHPFCERYVMSNEIELVK